MTPADLEHWRNTLGVSRAEACRRLGIAPNTWTAYQAGRAPIPVYIALACAALIRGIAPWPK